MAGELAVPVGDRRQAFNDAHDIASVACESLTKQSHAGQTHELRGPGALSFAEAVAIIGRASGRPVRFDGSVDAYIEMRTRLGATRESALTEVETFQSLCRRGDDEPNGLIESITGRKPVRFEDYADLAAKQGAWSDR